MNIYSASCPTCGYEHDFASKREMEMEWRSWHLLNATVFEKAMDALSIALTDRDKEILRAASRGRWGTGRRNQNGG